MCSIRRITAISMILLITLLASGCATLDRAECETGNWQNHGYTDGVRGRGGEFATLHQKACAKHGIDVGLQEYQQGYRLGLIDFCIPSNGWALGLQEEEYKYVCPSELEPQFLIAYRNGLGRALTTLHLYGHELEGRLWHARIHRPSTPNSDAGSQSNADRQAIRHARIVNSIESKLDYVHDREMRVRHWLSRAARHLSQLKPASAPG